VSQSFFVICILNVLLSNVFLQFLYVFFNDCDVRDAKQRFLWGIIAIMFFSVE